MARKSYFNKIQSSSESSSTSAMNRQNEDGGLSFAPPALFSGGAIQAKMGDGHDLTSPEFKGDTILEGVFDGEKVIGMGSSGEAVTKIQQKLLALGYLLPKYGADGIFGSETKTAICAFQNDHGLKGDGVVGKNTMSTLDTTSGKPEPDKPGPKPDKPDPKPDKPDPKPDNTLTLEKAKEQIENASRGWGTNEDSINDAIRRCINREGLANDPHIMKLLRKELSGGDLWKTLFLLQYGNEANFPKAINDILTAAAGWGTDEDAILKALAELSDADKKIFKNMPYLWELLEDELNTEELQKAFSKVVGTFDYAAALQRHAGNIEAAKTYIGEMKSGSTKERNTADWLDSTRPGGAKNIVHIMTRTHDGTARANHFGHTDNKDAYVGDTDSFPSNSGYEESLDSNRNISFVQRGTGGLHSGKHIWMFEPKKDPGSFKTVLVHEVQHDADRHDDEAGHDKPAGSPEESWNRYKSEFRAYWQDGRYDAISDTDKPSPDDGWQNKRQKTIFDLMINSGLYQHVTDNFKNNEKVDGVPYKDLLKAYGSPEGVNLENSPRIDDFYLQLKTCTKKHIKMNEDPLYQLKIYAGDLNGTDKVYINSSKAKALQTLIKANLDTDPLDVISKIIGDGTKPVWA